jgi:hypothetical protein
LLKELTMRKPRLPPLRNDRASWQYEFRNLHRTRRRWTGFTIIMMLLILAAIAWYFVRNWPRVRRLSPAAPATEDSETPAPEPVIPGIDIPPSADTL